MPLTSLHDAIEPWGDSGLLHFTDLPVGVCCLAKKEITGGSNQPLAIVMNSMMGAAIIHLVNADIHQSDRLPTYLSVIHDNGSVIGHRNLAQAPSAESGLTGLP
jgi:hypothetical protein